jgi:DNA-binding NarL/FixJ family response regulator
MTATYDDTRSPPDRAVRVLIADDQRVVRDGITLVVGLLDGIEVVGAVGDGAEAVAQAATLRPDVVLMDLHMPVLDGIEATRRILAASPATRIVILTAVRDRRDEALRAGAAAHMLKDAAPAELVRCLRLTAAG